MNLLDPSRQACVRARPNRWHLEDRTRGMPQTFPRKFQLIIRGQVTVAVGDVLNRRSSRSRLEAPR